MAADDDLLKEGKERFALASDAENDNRIAYESDVRFARHEEQWPDDIRKQRELDGRPCLTINKLNAFSRQVVNDARQNKPSIKVHPADSGADPDTAEVMNGLIRNIEVTSNADVAYDTAVDCAVNGGFGYIRVGLDYAYHDSFDMDLTIERVANPLSVYGDPNSQAADSSDWMDSFVVERLSQDQFKAKYGKDRKTIQDWDDTSWWDEAWREGNDALIAEWWHREEAEIKVQQFIDQMGGGVRTYTEDQINASPDLQMLIQAGRLIFTRERNGKTYRVKQRIMSGAEVLKDNDWAGCYIPIIPVYGDEYNIKGKRYFRSLIHPGIDAQRQFNYWRSAATELVALAPKAPYLVEEDAIPDDAEHMWNTANTKSWPYLPFKRTSQMPQRQPLDGGVAGGALQEALNASDDMKAVIGLYDASLGARSNETSGKAIMARQREGDVSTFHFIDNMSRAIRHTGRILLDLIPKVYTGERIVRVLGEDGEPKNVQLGKQYQKVDDKTGQPMVDEIGVAIVAMHDFSVGKYDLTVKTGPSFSTKREEAAYSMTEALRAFPQAADIIVPELAKNLDWPGADDIAEKFEEKAKGRLPPEVQQLIEKGKQELAKKDEEIAKLRGDKSEQQAELAIKVQTAQAELESKEQIAQLEIASDERIEMMRLERQMRLETYKAKLQADTQAQIAASRPQTPPAKAA